MLFFFLACFDHSFIIHIQHDRCLSLSETKVFVKLKGVQYMVVHTLMVWWSTWSTASPTLAYVTGLIFLPFDLYESKTNKLCFKITFFMRKIQSVPSYFNY